MVKTYNKAPKDLKRIINEVAVEVFSGYTDVPGYFASVDPIDGKGFVVVYSTKDGHIIKK